MALACLGNLRALSRRNHDPRAASRPFDRARDGFVIGEGGSVFVLESSDSARRRGAHAYAAVAGFGATSDAHHAVIPSPDPGPASTAIRLALEEAGVDPREIGYVNAHATGTPLGDVLEASALRSALGDASKHVPVSSTKSMTGHLLTASGAVECLACLGALDRQALPPTINLDEVDPQCSDLNHVRNEARPHTLNVAISNSFGFGGSNTCLVLRSV
jgi:3-oxoacyl-[acyl-carrier-protein] synthase II